MITAYLTVMRILTKTDFLTDRNMSLAQGLTMRIPTATVLKTEKKSTLTGLIRLRLTPMKTGLRTATRSTLKLIL